MQSGAFAVPLPGQTEADRTADPGRNPHRTGAAWTLRTVAAILANPRYTGRQVWNRQRTDFDPADPADTTVGHRQVQRWNLPEGWVIEAPELMRRWSARPTSSLPRTRPRRHGLHQRHPPGTRTAR